MTYRQSRPPQAIALRRCPFKRVNCEARRDPNITFVRTEIAVYSPEDGCSQGQRQVHDSTYRVTEEAVVQGCPLPPLRAPSKSRAERGSDSKSGCLHQRDTTPFSWPNTRVRARFTNGWGRFT